MRLSVHLVGKCAMLRAIESPSSRKQLLCTAPRLPVVPLKQQQCCPRYLPSLDPRPALRVHRHRCFAASPMQSLQDAEDVGRGKTWDVKMLFDGAPLHVTATKAPDSSNLFHDPKSVIIRHTPVMLGTGERTSWVPGGLCYPACAPLDSTYGTHPMLGSE